MSKSRDRSYFRWRGWIPIPIYLGALVLADLSRPLAAYEYVLGGLALVAGLTLRGAARLHIGRSSDTRRLHANRLITDGPFAWTRNPIYLGNICLAAGIGWIAGGGWVVPVLIVLLALHYWRVILAEEKMLAETFGQAYSDYTGSVGRFLPRAAKVKDLLHRLRRERRIAGWVLLAVVVLVAYRAWSGSS